MRQDCDFEHAASEGLSSECKPARRIFCVVRYWNTVEIANREDELTQTARGPGVRFLSPGPRTGRPPPDVSEPTLVALYSRLELCAQVAQRELARHRNY